MGELSGLDHADLGPSSPEVSQEDTVKDNVLSTRIFIAKHDQGECRAPRLSARNGDLESSADGE